MKTNKKYIALFSLAAFSLLSAPSVAQNTDQPANPLTISGYADLYYSYDFNKPDNHQRQPFMYAFNRHNEITLNLGMIKASYQATNVRSNLALMVGTYANDNMAAEAGVLKNVYEANVGIKLSRNHLLWLDAGILPSHIGFESAIGSDCQTLTRSIIAENSPYFETGAKLSYGTPDDKWQISALVLNGWQRIARVDGNNTPAFGHQVVFKPSGRVTLNSSSFIGSDKPDSTRQMRYFHDLYGQFQLTDNFCLAAGFDIGWEQKAKNSSGYNNWYGATLIGSYMLSDKCRIAGRVEYYKDKNGVIIASTSPGGFSTWGYSLNLDYLISEYVMWRMEARHLNSPDKVFVESENPTKNDTFVSATLAVRF